jgi:transcriptional regulator with XRE-family HTH domain
VEYIADTTSVDSFIGRKVKQRRSELGISQGKLGEYLGVSFQQIQKYENGKNRISASSLVQISRILGVDFSYFVNGCDGAEALRDGSTAVYQSRNNKELTLLVTYFLKIKDPALRKQILDLTKKISLLSTNE